MNPMNTMQQGQVNHGMAGLQQQQQQQQQMQPQGGPHNGGPGTGAHSRSRTRAYTEIIEQPAPKSLRFRYECEGRSAGSIPGIRSTAENKTFPAIRVVGHRGEAFVVVSCVTKDPPYKPHPHNLVGRDCKTGVCTVKMSDDNMSITFNNLGIQCIRKKDIEEALRKREEIKVDPYKTGFQHRNQPSSIDLNAIRLCFQVFVNMGAPHGLVGLVPVVSEPIYDKKAMSELVIMKISHYSAPVNGGQEIILLCEKVAKEDIAVRLYEEQNGKIVWEANGDFQHNNVHKQVAISFKIPPYRLLTLDQATQVFMQLRRPSDGATSEPIDFQYVPVESGEQNPKRKKIENRNAVYDYIRGSQEKQQQFQQQLDNRPPTYQAFLPGVLLNPVDHQIKEEPREPSPGTSNLNTYREQPVSPHSRSPMYSPPQHQILPGPVASRLNVPAFPPQDNGVPVHLEQQPATEMPSHLPFVQYPPNTQAPPLQWNLLNNLSAAPFRANPLHQQPQQQPTPLPTMNTFQNMDNQPGLNADALDPLNSTDLEELIRRAQGTDGSMEISDSLKGLVLENLTNAAGNL